MELRLCSWRAQADRGDGSGLVVLANLSGDIEAVVPNPALDEPQRMRQAAGQRSRRLAFFGNGLWLGGEFAQDSIHEGRRRAFAGALYQFDTLVQRRTLGDAV